MPTSKPLRLPFSDLRQPPRASISTLAVRTVLALSWVILSLLGCAGPVIQGRIIEQGPHDIIRLDREQSDSQSGARFDHPSLWTPEDMSAILARLLLEDRVGFMDSPKPPRPVFSPEDIRRLSPLFSAALSQATPSEWVSFVIKEEPAGGQIMLTSGACSSPAAACTSSLPTIERPLL
ncbi:MAG: hypothetical protein U0361_11955 [Nitrospiraceae bacterium]